MTTTRRNIANSEDSLLHVRGQSPTYPSHCTEAASRVTHRPHYGIQAENDRTSTGDSACGVSYVLFQSMHNV